MTPKDKAVQLVAKFFAQIPTPRMKNTENGQISSMSIRAKKCASISADEVIIEWQEVRGDTVDARKQIIEKISYWRSVKIEIEKL